MHELMLSDIIAECEQWADEAGPDDTSESAEAWRLGFAAALQRVELVGRRLIDELQ